MGASSSGQGGFSLKLSVMKVSGSRRTKRKCEGDVSVCGMAAVDEVLAAGRTCLVLCRLYCSGDC